MASDHYSGLSFPVYGSLDSEYPYPSTVDLYTGLYAFEHGIPAEHTATTSPMQRVMPALPIIHSTNPLLSPISECNTSLISAEARGIYLAQCHVSTSTTFSVTASRLDLIQATYPSYAEKTTQTTNLDTSGECKRDHWEEAHQMCRPPLKHKMAPQELYKATRHLTGFGESDIIEFIVDSEEGICLSNASEDNWVGFKGGDDRSLFEGDRLQIMIRLHVRLGRCVPTSLMSNFPFKFVGCSPWHSKVEIRKTHLV